jgi:hypothetical protein
LGDAAGGEASKQTERDHDDDRPRKHSQARPGAAAPRRAVDGEGGSPPMTPSAGRLHAQAARRERRSLLAERRVMPYFLMLVFCSIVDWALTADALIMGIATEGNPVMAAVIELDPAASFAVKLAVPVMGGLLLYTLRSHRAARLAMKSLACVFGVAVVYQVVGRLFIM